MIHIYTSATPNGWKATVTLEELEIPYKIHAIDLSEGEQHTEEFLKLNPNGRIPVLHDDETETTVFESGALMLYLAKKYEKLVPKEERDYWQCLQWLMFQMEVLDLCRVRPSSLKGIFRKMSQRQKCAIRTRLEGFMRCWIRDSAQSIFLPATTVSRILPTGVGSKHTGGRGCLWKG